MSLFVPYNGLCYNVLTFQLESTVNNNESRFSVFGPGCLSENRSGIQFVCERLRKQRQALANAQLDCKVIESQKDDALTVCFFPPMVYGMSMGFVSAAQ